MKSKVALLILDGWGIGKKDASDAIFKADTRFVNSLYARYPNAKLSASGEDVGLPEGQMGNSEVGHMNIGAGRVVYQQLVLINKAFREGTAASNEVLNAAFDHARRNQKKLHLIGLVSDGGVHSSDQHLKALLSLSQQHGVQHTFVHAFTDGRDTSPEGGAQYLQNLQHWCKETGAQIASVVGRYYAMDRDKRWERVKLAYDLLVHGRGTPCTDPIAALKTSYANGVTDEFIQPLVCVNADGAPLALIEPGDVVINFNFRTDRGRQITEVLTQKAHLQYEMEPLPLYYVTLTEYDATFKEVKVVFQHTDLTETLGEVLAKAGKTQLRIAETEKYPHVTFFFSGGREAPFHLEERTLCPSPKVATYDLQPEMSAEDVKNAALEGISKGFDFLCVNFANPDMVGHTGVFEAVMKAVQKVDSCVEAVVNAGLNAGYRFIIIADHGNAEYMINPDGTPHTAHTTNLVPCFIFGPDFQPVIRDGRLADVAPSILEMMGIEQPAAMTGESLIKN